MNSIKAIPVNSGSHKVYSVPGTSSVAWWWILLGAVGVVVRTLSSGIIESGDGVHHFEIAANSWDHPELFLNKWGKPLFTLLASPFAQLGLWGMTLFNALCFIGTCWAADGILKRAGIAARWLFPPVLLLVPVYGTMVLGGMTEVLFGLLTILAIRAAFEDRPVLFALIVSLMPFSRPEYVGFLPFALLWVLYGRAWHALPVFLAGHLIYALFAFLVLNDPLSAFHDDPYTGAQDIYGSGRMDHFITNTDVIYGPLWVAFLIAIGVAGTTWRWPRSTPYNGWLLTWLAVLPAIAIVLVHSVLWWQGLKGSLGLIRVLATTAPMLALFTCYTIVRACRIAFRLPQFHIMLSVLAGLLYLSAAAATFLEHRPLPVEPDEQHMFINSVSDRINLIREENTRVIYHSPYIGHRIGVDPYSPSSVASIDQNRPDLGLNEGDLVVWDAHFSPNEGHTSLEWLLQHPALRFVERHEAPMPMIVLGGRQFEIFVFERRDTRRWSGTIDILDQQKGLMPSTPHRIDITERTVEGSWGLAPTEFPLELVELPLGNPDVAYGRVDISGEMHHEHEPDQPVLLVFEESNGSELLSYRTIPIGPGPFSTSFQTSARPQGTTNKLFFWNRSEKPIGLEQLHISIFQHKSEPL